MLRDAALRAAPQHEGERVSRRVPGLASLPSGRAKRGPGNSPRDTRVQRAGWTQPVTLAAAALLAGFAPDSWVGESSASSARLIVAWRVAEVIFAPNRSVM